MKNKIDYTVVIYFMLTFVIVLGGCRNQTPLSTPEVGSTSPTEIASEEGVVTLPTTTSSPALVIATRTAVPSPTPSPTILASITPTSTVVATMASTPQPITPSPGMILIDHNSVALFDQIPDQYLNAAADLRMIYIDRSVGANINDGLDCLAFPTDEEAPHFCSVYEHAGTPSFSSDPSEVDWSRVGGYGRENWHFESWGLGCGLWAEEVDCFINRANEIINQYDVLSFQFSYGEVNTGSTIANQPGGFFDDNPNRSDVYDLEVFEAQHPGKIIIYWTTSLARSIGTQESNLFNDQMRQYAITNHKILFDVADILAHDPDGNPCYDNRDGIAYSNNHSSENFPDDNQDLLAICQHYTTETEGGHLGSTSVGVIRVSKAFWVLMARIAGWDGVTLQ